jgi:hypothetical protein
MAQSSEAMTDKELVQRLLKRIDELDASQKQMQSRIDKLTAVAPNAAVAVAAPVAAPAPVVEVPEATTASEPESAHVLGPVQFRGFGDFGYGRALFENYRPKV